MQHDRWHLVANGRPVGEFAEYELMQWLAVGRLKRDDLLWRDGMIVAAPAGTVAPFSAHLPKRAGDDAAMRWLLPVGRAPWAIAAGYLGILCIVGVFAPFAVVAGILGIRQLHRNPQLHGMGRAIFGICAGSAVIVLAAVALLSTR